MKERISFYIKSITAAYNQVFFADSKWFALALFVASFSDFYTGLSGLLSVLFAIMLSKLSGMNQSLIANGTYTYNVLLVGLTMGAYYQVNSVFFIVLLLASFITLMLSVWLSASLAVKKLPFLSLPFVLGIWIILLSTRGFGAISLSERGIYTYNDMWSYGGSSIVNLYGQINNFPLPHLITVYLKSMGAVFFQNNILAGALITAGLIIFSRIAFTLSVIGFLSGYFFCTLVQGNLSDMEYSYIGFNYILTAMAVGSFFLIPSAGSYILAAVSAPLVSLFAGALSKISSAYMLPLYSLPFTLVVLLILYTLLNRYSVRHLHLVQYQLFSPEKNLYAFHNYAERFKKDTYIHIHLPFYGEWFVSQGYEGNMTHKSDWRFALDFVVKDEKEKTYRFPGQYVTDFYCYNLPVIAPAAGYVTTLQDGIDDNAVGDANLAENWGNTIIIKHSDYLYSKISHIKKESFKVKVGDYVKKGDLLALCGNSGRSPEPHIHFQLQSVPYVGGKTLEYPVSYYISRKNDRHELHSFEVPKEGETILRPIATPLLKQAFHFIPGMKLNFKMSEGKQTKHISWEVFTTATNESYLYCAETQSSAYFVNNETVFYFTAFYGDKDSLLYYFYLGAHKILLSYFEGLTIKDSFPLQGFYKGGLKFVQDIVAPFYLFIKPVYKNTFVGADNPQSPSVVKMKAEAAAFSGNSIQRRIDFEAEISANSIRQFIIKEKGKCITAKNIA